MLRVVTQARPTWVVAENVANLVNMGIDTCLSGLEAEGYTTRAIMVPACGVGANHRRQRFFIIARNFDEQGLEGAWTCGTIADPTSTNTTGELCYVGEAESRSKPLPESRNRYSQVGDVADSGNISNGQTDQAISAKREDWRARHHVSRGYWGMHWRDWLVEPVIRGGDDGFPYRVDRLRALGNAVVPGQALPIFDAIAKEIRKKR